jgi:hypothetical protein
VLASALSALAFGAGSSEGYYSDWFCGSSQSGQFMPAGARCPAAWADNSIRHHYNFLEAYQAYNTGGAVSTNCEEAWHSGNGHLLSRRCGFTNSQGDMYVDSKDDLTGNLMSRPDVWLENRSYGAKDRAVFGWGHTV